MSASRPIRIVITGAPGSAKTEFFERLQTEEALAGFMFFEELARKILMENPAIRHRQIALHREIYERQTSREAAAGNQPFITDRGTVDAFAFHPETMTAVGTTLEVEYGRYTGVVQLGSAAALGERHYQQDRIRTESIAEAMRIERAIKRVWRGHPHYSFVKADIDLERKYGLFRHMIVQYTGG